MKIPAKGKPNLELAQLEGERIFQGAEACLDVDPFSITEFQSLAENTSLNDYYSEAPEWWPESEDDENSPYVENKGTRNPNAFRKHKEIAAMVRASVACLAAGYEISGIDKFAEKAVRLLNAFFVDEKTRMNPNLNFSQAIPGVCSGRAEGILDAVQLLEVPVAVRVLTKSPSLKPQIRMGVQNWFKKYLEWLTTGSYGEEAKGKGGTISLAWALQVALFGQFTGRMEKVTEIRGLFKESILAEQLNENSEPVSINADVCAYEESIFRMDMLTCLCHVLSNDMDNLWSYETGDGRSVVKGVEALFPYIKNKDSWANSKNEDLWDLYPGRPASILFAGYGLKEEKYLELWRELEPPTLEAAMDMNAFVVRPILWYLAH